MPMEKVGSSPWSLLFLLTSVLHLNSYSLTLYFFQLLSASPVFMVALGFVVLKVVWHMLGKLLIAEHDSSPSGFFIIIIFVCFWERVSNSLPEHLRSGSVDHRHTYPCIAVPPFLELRAYFLFLPPLSCHCLFSSPYPAPGFLCLSCMFLEFLNPLM